MPKSQKLIPQKNYSAKINDFRVVNLSYFSLVIELLKENMPRKKDQGQTYFNERWLTEDNEIETKVWGRKGSTNTTYVCKLCKVKYGKERLLGDTGIGALKKHARGENHNESSNIQENPSGFFQSKKSSSASNQQSQSVPAVESTAEILCSSSSSSSTSSLPSPIVPTVVDVDVDVASTPLPRPISSLIKKGSKIESEIIWIMDCI